jgi:hypothetical protein
MYDSSELTVVSNWLLFRGLYWLVAILPLLTCISPRSHKFNVCSNAIGIFVVFYEFGAFIVLNLLIIL